VVDFINTKTNNQLEIGGIIYDRNILRWLQVAFVDVARYLRQQ